MSSLFTKIVQGDIPCHKIAEDDNYLAFLDINPVAKGHTLCIPKKEIDYIFDLDDSTLSGLTLFSKKVAHAIQQVVPCNRIGITVIGLEVPHAHVHLIPIHNLHDMSFEKAKIKMTNEELSKLASQIAAQFRIV